MGFQKADVITVKEPVEFSAADGSRPGLTQVRPTELVRFQSFLPHAKAVFLPVKDFDFIAPPVAEYEELP